MKGLLQSKSKRLYIGDIQSDWHYLASLRTRSAERWKWEVDDTSKYLGEQKEFKLIFQADSSVPIHHTEDRLLNYLPSLLIIDELMYDAMDDNARQLLLTKTLCKVRNTEFKTFEQYTKDILGKKLISPENMTSMDLDMAKDYRDAICSYTESIYSSPELVKRHIYTQDDLFLVSFTEKHKAAIKVGFAENFDLVWVEFSFSLAPEEEQQTFDDSVE